MKPGYHYCPAGCGAVLANSLFACREDWARLPAEIQADILRTRRRSILDPERAEILVSAMEFYRSESS